MNGITRFRVYLSRNIVKNISRCARSVQTLAGGDIRNIALMAHIDSGKTTLTESILHASEYVSTPGSVDTGSTTTDFLPAERARGITIQSASIPVHWKKWIFNLIDTPGHADFGMEVESASRVIDGAIVLLDGVEGVEAQTKGVWSQLNRHNVPTRLLFVNKLDRPGSSLHDSLISVLSHRLHPRPVPLTLPVASFNSQRYQTGEPGLEGVVDIVQWKAYKWSESENSSSDSDLSTTGTPESLLAAEHPLLPVLKEARTNLIDQLSVNSADFMEEFLSFEAQDPYMSFPSSKIIPHLRDLTLRKEILPVFSGSALHHIGTKVLMDYIGELLASPLDIKGTIEPDKRGGVGVLAWKVGWDRQKGWMTFVRVYSGSLSRSSMLYNTTTGQKERISKLVLCYANEHKEVDALPFGSVGVILGLKHTRTGDTLVSVGSSLPKHTKTSITAPPATVSASVISQSHSDIQAVQEALTALSRTDPSVRWTEEDGQTLIHGLGALHLEIVEGRLKDEFGAHCSLGRRRVTYKETLGGSTELIDSLEWNKEMAGKASNAKVELSLRKLEDTEEAEDDWDGNLVLDSRGNRLPSSTFEIIKSSPELAAVIQGLQSPLSSSPHSALPITRVCVTVKSFFSGPSSPPAALASAASALLRQMIRDTEEGNLLEPFIQVKVHVPEIFMGKVVKDLTENGGEIQEMLTDTTSLSSIGVDDDGVTPFSTNQVFIPPAWISPSTVSNTDGLDASRQRRSVHAIAPLSKMLDFQSRLRAISGGQATFEMSSVGFREVDPSRKLEILREMGRA